MVEATAKVTTLDKRGADGQLIGVDDNAICIYRMSGGAIGTMTASWTYYGAEDNSTVLYGTKGILRIYDDPAYSLKLITAGGRRRSTSWRPSRPTTTRPPPASSTASWTA